MILLLVSLLASAACPSLKGDVVVFGGRGATQSQMQQCYPDFLALANDSSVASCLAAQIDASPRVITVVGHSSGAAAAERVAHAVHDKKRVRLILLEGFGSPANQRGVDTTCWYAQNRSLQGMNASYMKNPADCTGRVKAYSAPWCHNALCLHVSLVNTHTPADLTRETVFTEGLHNCQGNLEWLK